MSERMEDEYVTLVDPRDLNVRYIGLSTKGMSRPRNHRNASGGSSGTYRGRWLAELGRTGHTFNIVILEVCDERDFEHLKAREIWWIAYGRLSGWRLTNGTLGGDGCVGRRFSAKSKAKIRKARILSKFHKNKYLKTKSKISNT